MADLFSKRLLGQLNYFLNRQSHFEGEQLLALKPLFEQEGIEYAFVSGDLSSTSLKAEFKTAQKLFQEMEKSGIKCFFVPGNHDHYTKEAQNRQLFYQYFTNHSSKQLFSLQKDGVEAHLLQEGFWYVGLDCALATGLLSSHGLFSHTIEKNLQTVLQQISPKDKIILVNHFPFLKITSQRKELRRKEALEEILKNHPNIVLYLHGHTHSNAIEDRRDEGLPLSLDSGSAAFNTIGRLNLIDLEKKHCRIRVFEFKDKWQEELHQNYIF
jgi:3',5'-cyclic AMP phosphodiesterase CpdA